MYLAKVEVKLSYSGNESQWKVHSNVLTLLQASDAAQVIVELAGKEA